MALSVTKRMLRSDNKNVLWIARDANGELISNSVQKRIKSSINNL